jgi:hypothetical protein
VGDDGRERFGGWPENHAIRLPLTQLGLTNTPGLTSVHINRLGDNFVSIAREGNAP